MIPGKSLSAESTLWSQCTRVLQAELTEQQFNTWIRPLQAVDDGSVLRLLAPNRFVIDWVQQHYLGRILEVVDDTDATTEVVVEVGSRASDTASVRAQPAPGRGRPSAGPAVASRLNPVFTFANFVEGKSNQLARAAATQVGENPGKSYNPLFIYGGVGLGKTHLMHAVGNAIVENNPGARVSYVHSERFVSDMVKGLQHNRISEFKKTYRSLDALLIDDIQFFAGKERSQEEFFHTFNSLLDLNRQIIMTSDRPPAAIATLEDRLRSRFQSGLLVDVEPPDLETRIAILRKKAEEGPMAVPDDVMEFIASNVTDNIRELEGALTRVTAYALLTGERVTQEMAASSVIQQMGPFQSMYTKSSFDHSS